MAARREWTIVRGDTIVCEMIFKQGTSVAAAVPVSVATDVWELEICNAADDTVLTGSVDGTIQLDHLGVTGKVRIEIPYAANTLAAGKYNYDIRRTTATGIRKTLVAGKFIVSSCCNS